MDSFLLVFLSLRPQQKLSIISYSLALWQVADWHADCSHQCHCLSTTATGLV